MSLEDHDAVVLAQLVELLRSVPPPDREPFLWVQNLNVPQAIIFWRRRQLALPEYSMHVLEGDGYIRATKYSDSGQEFVVTTQGFAAYEEWRRGYGHALAVETEVLRFLDDAGFRDRHPVAHVAWSDAIDQLWSGDRPELYQAIGGRCRDAMQAFATSLVALTGATEADSDPAHTKNRILSAVSARADHVGENVEKLLRAGVTYWDALTEVVNVVHHAASKRGRAVDWEDVRRCVFQTGFVMYELDRGLVPQQQA